MISGPKSKYLTMVLLLGQCCICLPAATQILRTEMHGWQAKDYRTDSIFGAGIDLAYKNLPRNRVPVPVIVAVIDDGVDTAHEDLAGHIWTNPKEIPGNGIDDDHNGYIDDVHGWNFLGGTGGSNITLESYESYREYYRLKQNGNPGDPSRPGIRKYYARVLDQFRKDSLRESKTVSMLIQMLPRVAFADSLLRVSVRRDSMSLHDFEEIRSEDTLVRQAKQNAVSYYKKYGISHEMPLSRFLEEGTKYLDSEKVKLENFSKDPDAARRAVVGDDFNNIDDRNYGNNNIAAGNPWHGTHVAGIIAAGRNNGIGMDGVADKVLIMPVRAVPDGDERDKDVALAIRYAVDNGARIINMSFGKYFSPGKIWVDEALQYAAAHDVLLVHVAGNESANIDTVGQYPSPYSGAGRRQIPGYLTVGCNTGGPDSLLVAHSSNYGQRVDLFAPGLMIYSTVTNNRYETYSGASMSTAMVSGVAALLLEYYPELRAVQLRDIIRTSVLKIRNHRVKLAVTGKMVNFSSLCSSAGILNAANAMKIAKLRSLPTTTQKIPEKGPR